MDVVAKKPSFHFSVPMGYNWLVESSLINFEPFSPMQPWYYLDAENIINVSEKWPSGPYQGGELIAFARRQDNDDMACFGINDKTVNCVIVIHAWTSQGYQVLDTYETFWEWVKSIIDDIAEWID